MQNVHFSPPDLAPLFGVNVSTIKRWVDRGLLASEMTPGGHRRVRQDQLKDFLRRYPNYTDRSYVLRRLHKLDQVLPAWQEYEAALFARRDQAARAILEQALWRRIPVAKIFDDFIAPTLVSVGAKWSRGEASIYDEHRISFQIRTHIQHLDDLLPDPAPGAPVAVLACAPGDAHELPLQMVGLVLKEAGWIPESTGINTPLSAIREAIDRLHPRVVAITCTFRKPGLDTFLRALRRLTMGRKIELLYGGGGWTASERRQRGYIGSLNELTEALPSTRSHARRQPTRRTVRRTALRA